jgi:RimJ/RimL family protein N-acetyltransferase
MGVGIGEDPLRGRLVRLRAVAEDDLPTLARWWADPAVATFQDGGPLHPKPVAKIMDMLRSWSTNESLDVGLAVTTLDGELAGHAALHQIRPKDRVATYGIMIGPEFQNRGVGTDTTRVMLRYGFTELNLRRIQLLAFGYNERAIAAYRKAGFREEGRRREATFRGGRYHDEVIMGVLRREWTEPA